MKQGSASATQNLQHHYATNNSIHLFSESISQNKGQNDSKNPQNLKQSLTANTSFNGGYGSLPDISQKSVRYKNGFLSSQTAQGGQR